MDHPIYKDYIILSNGKIYSKKNSIFLKPFNNKDGYKLVDLFLNGKSNMCRVHRLVADIYCENFFNYPQVHHINGIRDDNRSSNLQWVTNQMNCQSINTLKNFGSVYMWLNHDIMYWRHNIVINKKQYAKLFETEGEARLYKLFLHYAFHVDALKKRM